MNLKKEFEKSSLKIMNSAPIGMAIAYTDGTLLHANKSFSTTIGYSQKELVGMNFTEFTHPDDLEFNINQNNKVASGKIPSYQMEKRYITKNGEILHAIMKVTSLKMGQGDQKYFLAQVLDITEKVDLINQKVRSEAEFREIFEEAAIAIAYADSNGVIENVNRALCTLLEYRCEELIGKHISEISHPEDMVINAELTKSLLEENGTNYSMQKRYVTKSGKTIHALLKVSYLKGTDDRDSKLLGQIVDLSEQKKFEELLKANNRELTKVNSELDSFIYRASHDLKGPMATLKGLINLVKIKNLDPEIIDGMTFSIQKLENTIRELVEFSENSQKTVSEEEFNLVETVDECIDVLKYHPYFSSINFKREIPVDLVVKSDKRRLKPVLNNLLINSINFHNRRKANPFILVKCVMEKNTLILEITDNGLGMTPEVKDRAFDMFYRGSEISTGSGLGLYLVKEIVAKLGGTVSLASRYGEGTTVMIEVPQ